MSFSPTSEWTHACTDVFRPGWTPGPRSMWQVKWVLTATSGWWETNKRDCCPAPPLAAPRFSIISTLTSIGWSIGHCSTGLSTVAVNILTQQTASGWVLQRSVTGFSCQNILGCSPMIQRGWNVCFFPFSHMSLEILQQMWNWSFERVVVTILGKKKLHTFFSAIHSLTEEKSGSDFCYQKSAIYWGKVFFREHLITLQNVKTKQPQLFSLGNKKRYLLPLLKCVDSGLNVASSCKLV